MLPLPASVPPASVSVPVTVEAAATLSEADGSMTSPPYRTRPKIDWGVPLEMVTVFPAGMMTWSLGPGTVPPCQSCCGLAVQSPVVGPIQVITSCGSTFRTTSFPAPPLYVTKKPSTSLVTMPPSGIPLKVLLIGGRPAAG